MRLSYYILIILSLLLQSCLTSAVESAAVAVIAAQSEKQEINGRSYKAIDTCLFQDRPEAYAIAGKILYDQELQKKYYKLLDPNNDRQAFIKDANKLPQYYLAYAYYLVADKTTDNRAQNKIKWLDIYLKENETKQIKEYIDTKYLDSYLKKCFTVPLQYKKYLTTIQKINNFRD